MAKKEIEEDPEIDDSWLASYADAMTLLLAFFIMMFAFALVDEEKFLDFKVGVVAALGVADPVTDNTSSILGDGQGIAPEIGLGAVPASQVEALMRSVEDALRGDGTVTADNAEEVKELLEAKYEIAGLADLVGVEITERGIVVRFEGRLLFESGSDRLTGDADIVLGETAAALKNFDNQVDIEGHTDDRPTGDSAKSNWHLSTARASTVVLWLIERGNVEDVRLTPMGFSDTRPRASNSTADGRQENRRVELVILVDGLLASDVDLINAIPADIVGGAKQNPLGALPESDADSNTADADSETNGQDGQDSDGSDAGTGPAPATPLINPIPDPIENGFGRVFNSANEETDAEIEEIEDGE